MKKFIKISVIFIVLIGMIIIPTFAKTGKVVNTDEVRFRAKASAESDSEVLGMVSLGTEVEILDTLTGWYKVKYNGQTGYINASYLVEVTEEESSENTLTENTEVTENQIVPENTETTENQISSENNESSEQIEYNALNNIEVKLNPLINSVSTGNIKKGEKCNIISELGKWYYVETDTTIGWVLKTNIGEKQVAKDTIYQAAKKGYVNLESINVRKEPSTSSELITKLKLNTEVTIIGEIEDWYLVELDGQNVYIFKELLSDSKIVTTSRSSEYDRTEVASTATSLNLEENANNKNDTQQSAQQLGNGQLLNETVQKEQTEGKTVNQEQAQTESNTVKQEQAQTESAQKESSITGEDVVAYAMQYLGYPYKYATAGPNSFDCSGFTSYVYKHFGYTISRSSSAQRYEGTEVQKQNLQKGDILIFLNTAKTAVGHVGIYIGNNQFIHASSSTTGVIISNLDKGSYPARYVTARRILK